MPDTPRTPAPGHPALTEMLEDSTPDDGAIHRFYEWLRREHYGAPLERLDVTAFRALVRRFDEGGAP